MSRRATKIKKKKSSVGNVFLYYAPDCDYSRELLSILLEVPILAQNVRCVDVRQYDVLGIENVPAIDDGCTKKPFEEQAAFMWVVRRCYKLLEDDEMVDSGQIDKDTVASIESRIEKMVRQHSRDLNGGVIDRGSKRKNKDQINPLDKFQSGANVRALATASYRPPQGGRMKDRWEELKERRASSNVSQMERYKNSEKMRQDMLERAKEEWVRSGLVDPETGTSSTNRTKEREEHKRSGITERDLARMDQDRLAMLDPIVQKYGNEIPQESQRIKQSKMGKTYKKK